MAPRTPPRHLMVDLVLPTAHCAGCRRAVLDELSRLEGIVDVVVDADRGTSYVTYDGAVLDVADIVRRLSEAGYPPVAPGTDRPEPSTPTSGE